MSRLSLAALASGFAATAASGWGPVLYQDTKILPSDDASRYFFGTSIAVDNGIVAIGSPHSYNNGSSTGSVYLFDAITGSPIATLLPSDGVSSDIFGLSIAFDRGIVAVGAPRHDGFGDWSGAAYLFDAATGVQTAKLLPSDGKEYQFFGSSVAIDDGVVALGAPEIAADSTDSGSAYVFDAQTGAQLAKLTADDGAAKDRFGYSIAIDNGIVAVGAHYDDDNGPDSGSAYLFDAVTGAQIAKLLPSDGAEYNYFGSSIAIDNGVVLIGAWGHRDNGIGSGSAYLFDAATGAQIAKLLPSDGTSRQFFGHSVAMDNGVAVVGAIGNVGSGLISGSVYLYDATTGSQMAKLIPTDGAWRDGFGSSVAIDGGTIAVGAMYDDDVGSAYLFRDLDCPADWTGDFVIDFFDIAAFLGYYMLHDPIADLNGDGVWDFFDVQLFLTAYAAGCE